MLGAQSQAQEVVDSARASFAKSHFTTETVSKVSVEWLVSDFSRALEITKKNKDIIKIINSKNNSKVIEVNKR